MAALTRAPKARTLLYSYLLGLAFPSYCLKTNAYHFAIFFREFRNFTLHIVVEIRGFFLAETADFSLYIATKRRPRLLFGLDFRMSEYHISAMTSKEKRVILRTNSNGLISRLLLKSRWEGVRKYNLCLVVVGTIILIVLFYYSFCISICFCCGGCVEIRREKIWDEYNMFRRFNYCRWIWRIETKKRNIVNVLTTLSRQICMNSLPETNNFGKRRTKSEFFNK